MPQYVFDSTLRSLKRLLPLFALAINFADVTSGRAPAPDEIVINEIKFEAQTGACTGIADQFIELFNNTDDTLELGGCSLHYDGTEYVHVIPLGKFIVPRGYFLLTSKSEVTCHRVTASIDDQWITGNHGFYVDAQAAHELRIYNQSNELLDVVRMPIDEDADLDPDGANSYELVSPNRDNWNMDDPAVWRPSSGTVGLLQDGDNNTEFGTPGLRNSVSPQVYIVSAGYDSIDGRLRCGDRFFADFGIVNQSGSVVTVGLGLSIAIEDASNPDPNWISDPVHDRVVDVPSGTSTALREFQIPVGIKPGFYRMELAIWSGTPGEAEVLDRFALRNCYIRGAEFFDDFDYESRSELVDNGWKIRGEGDHDGPGAKRWQERAVDFGDVNVDANQVHVMTLEASGLGSVESVVQADVRTEREFQFGTTAALVRIRRIPGGDSMKKDLVVLAPLFQISHSMPEDPTLSETDIEYYPNGDAWGGGSRWEFVSWDMAPDYDLFEHSNELLDSQYRAVSPLLDEEASSDWVLLAIQSDSSGVSYFKVESGVTYAIPPHASKWAPDSLMSIAFEAWYLTEGPNSTANSFAGEYAIDVDWVYHAKDERVSLAAVLGRIAEFRSANIGLKRFEDVYLEQPVILVPAERQVDADGGDYPVEVKSNTSWVIGSDVSWLSATRGRGIGNSSFNVTVDRNPSLEARAGHLNIGGVVHTVIQEGASGSIVVAPSVHALGSGGGSYPLSVIANTSWSVSSDATWLSVVPNSGQGDGRVFIDVMPNTGREPRSASVVIGGQAHVVTQAGTPAVSGVVAWGRNNLGQTQVPDAARQDVVAVAAGDSHGVALKSDGSVVAWGWNAAGQASPPARVSSGVVAVSAGVAHSVALLASGEVVAWGTNDFGQTDVPTSAQSGVVKIKAGWFHTLALKADGSVVAWGDNQFGQCDVPASVSNRAVSLAAGAWHSMVRLNDDSAVAWGWNSSGQSSVPASIQGHVLALEGGFAHSMALTDAGKVIAWGYNSYGQCDVPGGAQSGVRTIAAGGYHSMAIDSEGRLVDWGRDNYSQTSGFDSNPGDYVQVAAGEFFSVGLRQVIEAPRTEISPVLRVVAPEGEQYSVGVSSNTAWSVGVSDSWIEASPSSGEGDGEVTVTVAANFGVNRTGMISIGGQEHRISQDALVGPTITQAPVSKSVVAGQAVTLSVTADGVPAPSYQWRKGGAPMQGATGASYRIDAASLADDADYDVVVSNVVGSVLSGVAHVTVQMPPVITAQPMSQTVAMGHAVTLSVTASGVPAPSYQWRKGGVEIEGATGASHSFAAVVLTDEGDYDVVVSNEAGSVVSDVAALVVLQREWADDFEGTRDNWWETPGDASANWQVAGGRLLGNYSILHGSRSNTQSILLLTESLQPSGDWTESVQFTLAPDAANPTLISSSASFALWLNESAKLVISVGRAEWNGDGAPRSSVDVGVSVWDGSWQTTGLDATIPVDWDPAGWNTARLDKMGTSYQVSLNGTRLMSFVDPALSGSGKVGLHTYGAKKLDNFQLQYGSVSEQAPSITVQPESRNVDLGTEVSFRVVAVGLPAPSYQWRRNGADIDGATRGQLTIPSVAEASGGSYDVVVTNMAGSAVSQVAALVVQGPISIDHQPVPQTVIVGHGVTLSLTASGVPAPSYQWRKDGVEIEGATGASYTIEVVSLADDADYDVVVSNVVDRATSETAHVTVQAPPVITVQPAPQTVVVVGHAVTLSVTASAVPAPSYQWRKGGEPMQGATGASYRIDAASMADDADYDVVVSNVVDIVTSETVHVTVQAPPVITVQPDSVASLTGASVSFTVVAQGAPPLGFQWFKDGVLLAHETAASLILPSVALTDAGSYHVVVSNEVGSITSNEAVLSALELGTTHGLDGVGYRAGGTVTINNSITYVGPVTALGWTVMPPGAIADQPWSFVGDAGHAGDVSAPHGGDTDLFEWAWSNIPASPFTFSYTMQVPANVTGDQRIVAYVTPRIAGQALAQMVQPDPLVIPEAPATHSADVNQDYALSLSELLRVIELYNYREGTRRTGDYHPDETTEDGFATGPREPLAGAFHSADVNRDGAISLSELLRVIELYNYRAGTRRTGAYHAALETEDGFAAGPAL